MPWVALDIAWRAQPYRHMYTHIFDPLKAYARLSGWAPKGKCYKAAESNFYFLLCGIIILHADKTLKAKAPKGITIKRTHTHTHARARISRIGEEKVELAEIILRIMFICIFTLCMPDKNTRRVVGPSPPYTHSSASLALICFCLLATQQNSTVCCCNMLPGPLKCCQPQRIVAWHLRSATSRVSLLRSLYLSLSLALFLSLARQCFAAQGVLSFLLW